MRLLPTGWLIFCALTVSVAAAAEPTEQSGPSEQAAPADPIVKVAAPAAPPTPAAPSNLKTIEVAGVKLELIEIPAGKFSMGATEAPPEPRWIGYSILGGGGGIAFLLVAAMLVRAIRERGRPQFSLLWYIILVLALGTAMLGVQRTTSDSQTWNEYRVGAEELPAHSVEITKPFLIGRIEVTQQLFELLMGNNPSFFKNAASGRQPVERVTWSEAVAFCEKLSERTHQTFRLPTEAEWEYACRAGTHTRYYFGDAERDLEHNAWTNGNSNNSTHPGGLLLPNASGLCDMHGNVMEWCQDWYDEKYYATAAMAFDPHGPASGETRVVRGGAWLSEPNGCRDSSRCGSAPEKRSYGVGFRVVMEK
jgi:formylglycine-generating enzyme required for sulfatase activity